MELIEIIDALRNTNSSNAKKEILEMNKDDEILKKVLLYTYDPFRKYGISEKIFDELIEDVTKEDFPDSENIYDFLDTLAQSNINNELKRNICATVKYIDPLYKDIAKCVFLKDLKIGLKPTSINKVWPNLIPKFDVQLAKKIQDAKLKDNELIYITEKLDGIRCVAIKNKDNVKFFTRQGKEITGLIVIEQAMMSTFGDKSVVLDGELLALNLENLDSGDLYRATVKIVNSKHENKYGVYFNVFDILSLEEFTHGKSNDVYSIRRQKMDSINWCPPLKLVPVLYCGTDHSQIKYWSGRAIQARKEGVMVNRDVVYQCKRNNGILKVKQMQSVDLRVIDVIEGEGRLENTLGALVVDYKGNKVNVGSGYSDEMRDKLWKEKTEIIGKIVEVQYFEESTNEQGGLSLRFPVFKDVRFDKTEPSYN